MPFFQASEPQTKMIEIKAYQLGETSKSDVKYKLWECVGDLIRGIFPIILFLDHYGILRSNDIFLFSPQRLQRPYAA